MGSMSLGYGAHNGRVSSETPNQKVLTYSFVKCVLHHRIVHAYIWYARTWYHIPAELDDRPVSPLAHCFSPPVMSPSG